MTELGDIKDIHTNRPTNLSKQVNYCRHGQMYSTTLYLNTMAVDKDRCTSTKQSTPFWQKWNLINGKSPP